MQKLDPDIVIKKNGVLIEGAEKTGAKQAKDAA
jgi:hypothetical protein